MGARARFGCWPERSLMGARGKKKKMPKEEAINDSSIPLSFRIAYPFPDLLLYLGHVKPQELTYPIRVSRLKAIFWRTQRCGASGC